MKSLLELGQPGLFYTMVTITLQVHPYIYEPLLQQQKSPLLYAIYLSIYLIKFTFITSENSCLIFIDPTIYSFIKANLAFCWWWIWRQNLHEAFTFWEIALLTSFAIAESIIPWVLSLTNRCLHYSSTLQRRAAAMIISRRRIRSIYIEPLPYFGGKYFIYFLESTHKYK